MKKITIFDVANWFLSKESMSPKKLQKIVYYAYSWFLTLMNESESDLSNKLFNSRIEAWVHGPVFPELYRRYKDKGWGAIVLDEKLPTFEDDVLDIFEQVWEVYGGYTGNQLESITHQEEPWIKARDGCNEYDICKNEITDKSIFSYYIERVS